MVGVVNERASASPFLTVAEGRNAGQRFYIDAAGKVLGSSATADIQLDDPKMSEMHAMVVLREGNHFIFDLGSETGTFVNDRRIEEAKLEHSDMIRIGNTSLHYSAFDQSAHNVVFEPPSAPPPAQGTYYSDVPPALAQRASRSLPPPGALIPAPPAGVGPQQYYGAPQGMMQAQQPLPLSPLGAVEPEEKAMSLEDVIFKIRQVIEFFRPYSRWILVFSLLGVLLGVALAVSSPPTRRATFSMTLVGNLADNPVDGRQQMQRPSLEFFRSAELNFKSPALIEKTLAALGEVDAGPQRVALIQKNLLFGQTSMLSSSYMGAYESKDPDEALRFLNAHVKLYLEGEIEKTLKVIKGQVEFLEKQVAETEKDLRRTEWELLEFKKKNIDGLPEQARQNYELLFDLQRQLAANDKEIDRVRAMKGVDYSRLKDEQALIPSRVLSTQPYQQKITDLKQRIAEGRANGMGVDHPEMIRWQMQMELLEKEAKATLERGQETEVEKQINPVYATIKDSVRLHEASEKAAYAERERLNKEIARVRGVVDRLPELETTYAELTRTYENRKNIHYRIFNQLETSKLQVELERASAAARYDIIAPPTLEIASPVKGFVSRIILGAVVGFMGGLGFATYKRMRGRISAAMKASEERALARIG